MIFFSRGLNWAGPKRGNAVTLNHQLWKGAYWVADTLLTPFYQLKISGAHNIPENGGFLLLPKHQRWQDIPLLGLAAARPLYYVAKYELFQYPMIDPLLRCLGGIPLNRKRPINTRWSFRASVDALKKGDGLVLFPEGTYFQKSMGTGRSGMLRFILHRVHVPLIPVGIEYASGHRPKKVFVRFGSPVHDSFRPGLMDQMMNDIARLSRLS